MMSKVHPQGFRCSFQFMVKAVIGGFALVLGLTQLWLMLQHTASTDKHIESPVSGSEISATKVRKNIIPAKLELRILLQHSPVDQKDQHLRLRAIDRGWAGWAAGPGREYRLEVFASVFPEDSPLYDGVDTLGNIEVIHVHPDPDPEPETGGDEKGDQGAELAPKAHRKRKAIADSPVAMQRMVDSFLWVLTSDSGGGGDDDAGEVSPMKWFVFSNDHAFFIPPNLAFALEEMDPETITYTGNMIGMQKTKTLEISFASGGAGAVLSHAALKCVVLSWVLLQPERVEEALCYLACHQAPAAQAAAAAPESSSGGTGSAADQMECVERIRAAFRGQLHASQDPRRGQTEVDWSTAVSADQVAAVLHWRAWSLMKKGRHRDKAGAGAAAASGLRGKSRSAEVDGDDLGATAVPTEIDVVVSRTVRVRVGFDDMHQLYLAVLNNTGTTSGKHQQPQTEFTEAELQQNCLDNSKWGLVNPGISVARCLRFVFGAISPQTQWDTLATPKRERFNVYGPVRTALGDFDPWYTEKKPEQKGVVLDVAGAQGAGRVPFSPVPTVSFHYVSQHESATLYRLLISRSGVQRGADCPEEFHYKMGQFEGAVASKLPASMSVGGEEAVEAISNYKELLRQWYTNSPSKLPAGAYSRKLGSLEEARKLYRMLYCDTIVL